MTAPKSRLKASTLIMACVAVVAALAAALFLVIGPHADAYFNPDPCYDAQGVMISCEG